MLKEGNNYLKIIRIETQDKKNKCDLRVCDVINTQQVQSPHAK